MIRLIWTAWVSCQWTVPASMPLLPRLQYPRHAILHALAGLPSVHAAQKQEVIVRLCMTNVRNHRQPNGLSVIHA